MKEGGFELCKDVEVMNENKQDENINCSPTLNESNHTRQALEITGDLNPDTLTFLFWRTSKWSIFVTYHPKIYFKDKGKDIWVP